MEEKMIKLSIEDHKLIQKSLINSEKYNKFETQFPSLKDKTMNSMIDNSVKKDSLIYVKDIQKHCFDKQRVREVIEEELVCDWDNHLDKHSNTCQKCNLKKRLGL